MEHIFDEIEEGEAFKLSLRVLKLWFLIASTVDCLIQEMIIARELVLTMPKASIAVPRRTPT